MPETPRDLIWIVEAAVQYERSRDWLDQQSKSGRLPRYKKPGDKRIYVSRNDVERLLAPVLDPGHSGTGHHNPREPKPGDADDADSR